MSSSPPSSGRTVVFAGVTALPGKADELQALLAAAIANANSDKEPYTLTYRAARHGGAFLFLPFVLGERVEEARG
jgi:hypothetical protein